MSTWFSQCVAYGYMATLEDFKRIVGDEWYEDDELDMHNNPDNIGWWVTDKYAFYGKLIAHGEGYGNDTLLVAESGAEKLDRIDASDFAAVCKSLKDMFGESKDRECDYYILGAYN